ncbi:hypothetical protein [Streptomyces sp. HB132]|uniref:hypothetical protein n=1 Tax=Streptomyces sp. HB132 TaxID=767388 RepID=UPI0019600E8A|nr:hypothetical protein [Streptomyces sp. HB132]MBM7443254.1 hypothetical protein [Streptomyces sp. HB132]
MITTSWGGTRRTAPSLAVAAALLTGLTACAGSAGYTTPKSLCDRTVDPDLLKPLLPDGEKVKAEQQAVGDPTTSKCVVTVDGSNALYVNEYRDQNYLDVQKEQQKTSADRNPQPSGTSENAVITDDAYVSLSPCPERGSKSNYILRITRAVPLDQARKQRSELEKFATAYRPEGLRAMGCR